MGLICIFDANNIQYDLMFNNVKVIICSSCNGRGITPSNPRADIMIPGDPTDIINCSACNGDGFFLKEKEE